jgi:Ca2+/H+ antiporter
MIRKALPIREGKLTSSGWLGLREWPIRVVAIASAVWLWAIILLVLYGACLWRNCNKLQTVSYAVCQQQPEQQPEQQQPEQQQPEQQQPEQ